MSQVKPSKYGNSGRYGTSWITMFIDLFSVLIDSINMVDGVLSVLFALMLVDETSNVWMVAPPPSIVEFK